MTHSFVTIIAAVPVDRIAAVRTQIEVWGNPASGAVAAALDAMQKIHFASLNVFEASAGDRGHLVFEFSGDGSRDDLLDKLATALEPSLAPIFDASVGRGSTSLLDFWKAHVVSTGQSLLVNPGLDFTGSPGLSVERIRRERDLARHLTAQLASTPAGTSALATLTQLRSALGSTTWSWALEPEPVIDDGASVGIPTTFAEATVVVAKLLPSFFATFLWPFAILAAVVLGVAWWLEDFTWKAVPAAAGWTFLVVVAAVLVVAGLIYRELRRREDAEVPIDRPPPPGSVGAIMERENFIAQNHLAALSVAKPGRLRHFTLILAFWVVGQLVRHYFRPGFLGSLGSIHFARWVKVPGTNDLLFLSNYGGSWESYLEDFITKAHGGLTAVWSNTLDFPATSNLFLKGATAGERFKRWARRQQIPTAFWYSAYPDVTTANIRNNAAIRQGLGAVLSESEARKWLSLFGSSARPVTELESQEIQSLLLGGLGFLHHGKALMFSLAPDPVQAKNWLDSLLPSISFSDGRSLDEAITLGLAASSLRKLGLPESSVATFPPAFTDGMTASWRSRVLGDVGNNAPGKWWWGGDTPAQQIDGVLLLYAKTPEALTGLHDRAAGLLTTYGHTVKAEVTFRPLAGKDATEKEAFAAKCEPFGFVDGISQPIIRGTYKALRGADAIHLVEPGEFILGYPDNRGEIPPGPVLAAIGDPANILPTTADTASPVFSSNSVNADRDLGRNGSFLAIRQLEQDIDAFWRFCVDEGNRLKPLFPPGVLGEPEEYIAAKLVGRWRDGSPLTRYPRYPASDAPVPAHPLARTAATGAAQRAGVPPPIAPSLNDGRRAALPAHQLAAAAAARAAAEFEKFRDSHGSSGGRRKPRPPFEPDNDFLFGTEDPQGLRCPFGAHIRRANPRESFDPGSTEQLGITNRHRIMRVGRFYEPGKGQKQGLFFMCLNGDLERQFEFVQQTWLESPSFHGLAGECDPLFSGPGKGGYTIPTRNGPLSLKNLSSFVSTRGGGYFFLPGRRTLQYLASRPSGPTPPTAAPRPASPGAAQTNSGSAQCPESW